MVRNACSRRFRVLSGVLLGADTLGHDAAQQVIAQAGVGIVVAGLDKAKTVLWQQSCVVR